MTIKHLGSIGEQEGVRIIHEKNAGGIEDQPIWVLLPVTYYIFSLMTKEHFYYSPRPYDYNSKTHQWSLLNYLLSLESWYKRKRMIFKIYFLTLKLYKPSPLKLGQITSLKLSFLNKDIINHLTDFSEIE